MRTRATPMRRIAAAFVSVGFAAAAAFPLASLVAADVQVKTEAFSFASPRMNSDAASNVTVRASTRRGTKGWIVLHRPDGEIVYIRLDQIVFVMSAKDTGAAERARTKLQLLNGHSDVRESVEEVMQAIDNDFTLAKEGI